MLCKAMQAAVMLNEVKYLNATHLYFVAQRFFACGRRDNALRCIKLTPAHRMTSVP